VAPRARPAAAVGPRLEEVIVIALAAARVARAISVDDITAPLRNRLTERAASEGDGKYHRARQLLVDLICCPVCVGWWASLTMSAMWPGGNRLRRGVSVAGAQVMLTLAERLVSEQGRLAVQEVESR
jgi:Protein of unknown function (DUF1360)